MVMQIRLSGLLLILIVSAVAQAETQPTELEPLIVEGEADNPLFRSNRRIQELLKDQPCLGCEGDTAVAKESLAAVAARGALGWLEHNLLPQPAPERDPADGPADDTLRYVQHDNFRERMNLHAPP